MKKQVFQLGFLLCLGGASLGEVSTTVYLADSNTPLEPVHVSDTLIEYPTIMVGTHLVIVVDSNESLQWDGGLFVEGPYRDRGVLYGRDYNDPTMDWEGSHLPEAGIGALVYDCMDDIRSGFDLYGHRSAVPGRWFVIDYVATDVGPCRISFYDYLSAGAMDTPVCHLAFSHVPTRDFNGDTIVNFTDYTILTACWWHSTPEVASPSCSTADLDASGNVDLRDMVLFADYWLYTTE